MYALRRTMALSTSLSTIGHRPPLAVIGCTAVSGNAWSTSSPAATIRPATPLLSLRSLLTVAGTPWSVGVPVLPVATQASSTLMLLSTISTMSSFSSALMKPSWMHAVEEWLQQGLYWISTLKRRRKMMNKHKLRKRRKKNRMKNK